MIHVYGAPPWQAPIEQAILAKLAEYGVALDAPDDELRRAFAGTIAPITCFRIAKELQERTAIEQAILAKLAEYGVALDAPDDELRRAFAGTVAPERCFRIAKELQSRHDLTILRDVV